MSGSAKASAIFGMVAGIVMPILWLFFVHYNLLWKISFTLSAALVNGTAICLIISGFGMIRAIRWGAKLFVGAMGSLLVQVLVDCDHFLSLNIIPLAIVFAIISLATIVFMLLTILSLNDSSAKVKS